VDYTVRLRGGDRLNALRVVGDEQTAVSAAFDLSYATMPGEARRMFRLLGLMPGSDVTVAAAAALTSTEPQDADTVLAQLVAAHLIDEHEAGRYSFHDLLRIYAAERSHAEDSTQERADAVRKLYDWYLSTVDAAAALLYPQMRRLTLPPGQRPAAFEDDSAASQWLDDERLNLVAAVTYESEHRPLPVVAVLADALRGYFWLRMHVVDWLAVA
jgi:hypothetical protein